MRETKFRGFSKKENKWVYGDLIKDIDKFNIAEKDSIDVVLDLYDNFKGCGFDYENIFDVEKESIGQFIGLKDKYGNEIYESDICKYKNENETYVGGIKYVEKYASFKLILPNGTLVDLESILNDTEVIGNIYENVELLVENKLKNKGAKYKAFLIHNLYELEQYFIKKNIYYTEWREVESYDRELRVSSREIDKKDLEEMFKKYNLKSSEAEVYVFYQL